LTFVDQERNKDEDILKPHRVIFYHTVLLVLHLPYLVASALLLFTWRRAILFSEFPKVFISSKICVDFCCHLSRIFHRNTKMILLTDMSENFHSIHLVSSVDVC